MLLSQFVHVRLLRVL